MKRALCILLAVCSAFCAAGTFAVGTFAAGTAASATAENIEYVEAWYFEPGKEPSVDGYISEAEWGEATFTVDASDCATKDDTEPFSRFLFWRVGDMSDYTSHSYTVWLRWSRDYFYLGVKANDPDGHQLRCGTTETWNGDAVQARIDRMGANAAVEGAEFTVTPSHQRPWSSSSVPDFLFGYVEIAGGFSEAWENSSNKGMTAFSKNKLGSALCVVAPAGSSFSSDTANGITTYEVGIPWTYILEGETARYNGKLEQITKLTYSTYIPGRSKKSNPDGGIGRELGMSIAFLNDGTNPDPKWDSFVSWGSGVCNASQQEGAKSATGSNAVTLSDKKVNQTAGYTKYNPSSLLDASFSTKNIDPPNTYYDYLAGDYYKTNKVSYEELSALTYDTDPEGDLALWGTPKYKGRISNIGGEHGNVLDYRDFIGTDQVNASDIQTYIDTSDEKHDFLFPPSFTFEFEICYTDTVVVQSQYDTMLFNWFGGSDGWAFHCGYNFNDRKFKIVNDKNKSEVLDTCPYDLKKDTWYNWKFQFDNESCNARLWVDDLSTDADNSDSPWGKLIFNKCWRYFYCSSDEARDEGVLLRYRMMNVQCMYDNVKIYNFASTKNIEVPKETGGELAGGGANAPTENVTGGGGLSTDSAQLRGGKWYIPVEVKKEYFSASKLSFTLEFDTSKAKFAGIEGIGTDAYAVKELDGRVTIEIKNFDCLKNLSEGDKFFEIVLSPGDAGVGIDDLDLYLSDEFTYSVNTGDGFAITAILAVSMTAGFVFTVHKRRKEH